MTESERLFKEIQRVGAELLHTPRGTPRAEQLQEELDELVLAQQDLLAEMPFWAHALGAALAVVGMALGVLLRPVFRLKRWWNLRRKS